MNMAAWSRCQAQISLDDFEGKPCFIGLDLAAKNDLTAKVYIFPLADDGKTQYAVFTQLWLPEKAVQDSVNSQYGGWVSSGLITETPGAMTDLNMVEASIRDDMSRFQVMGVAYDPWQATQLAETLAGDGAPMVEFRMTVQNVSDPMKRVEALVLDGRIRHDGNPAMTWMMSNVVARLDAKDNIFPRKERYENKIDGPVALILALGCAGTYEPEKPFDLDAFLAL
jgi:phage terminase large subunit-like protein